MEFITEIDVKAVFMRLIIMILIFQYYFNLKHMLWKIELEMYNCLLAFGEQKTRWFKIINSILDNQLRPSEYNL